jgi:hypothetical protein
MAVTHVWLRQRRTFDPSLQLLSSLRAGLSNSVRFCPFFVIAFLAVAMAEMAGRLCSKAARDERF